MSLLKNGSLFILLSLIILPARAIYLDSGVFTLETDKSFFSRQFVNDTPETNLYTISAWRIARPGKHEIKLPLANGELMYAPLKKMLQPGGREFFKMFYRGPEDDRERYYRIVIKEIPTTLLPGHVTGKMPFVSPVVALDTVMVVRPRKMHFDYHYDPQAGVLTNTGNTFFQVMIHRTCVANDDTSNLFSLLPGESYRGPDIVGEHRKFIIGFGRYIHLGNQCFENANAQ